MDIGESLFGWLWRRAASRSLTTSREVPLGRLDALATMLGGRPWRCAVVRDHHRAPPIGWTFLKADARTNDRPTTAGSQTLDGLDSVDFLRVLFGTTAFRYGVFLEDGTTRADAKIETMRAIPRVLDLVRRDLPASAELIAAFSEHLTPDTLGMLPQVLAGSSALTQLPSTPPPPMTKPTLVALKTRPPSAIETDDQKGDMPLQHVFEKALTADEYVGGQRTLDGEKDGSWSNDVLAELEVDRVIRTNETAQGYAESAYLDLTTAAEQTDDARDERAFSYPEWFEGSGAYKSAWCAVTEERPTRNLQPGSSVPKDNVLTPSELDHMCRQLQNRPAWRRRLLSGEELDLQAVVDWRADVASGMAGTAGSDRVYQSRHIFDLDTAITILIDRSLSTDTWIAAAAGQPNMRVLDAFKGATLAYADVLEAAGASFEVAAFNSRTRHQCRYEIFKSFEESWPMARTQIAGLEAADYTRLGPAIRHAATRLTKVRTRQRLLIVLSDAKPTDHDAYEGRHGMADVRRAAQELAGAGIKFTVVTLSRGEARLHARIFPNGTVRYADSTAGLCLAMHAVTLAAMKDRGRS